MNKKKVLWGSQNQLAQHVLYNGEQVANKKDMWLLTT